MFVILAIWIFMFIGACSTGNFGQPFLGWTIFTIICGVGKWATGGCEAGGRWRDDGTLVGTKTVYDKDGKVIGYVDKE